MNQNFQSRQDRAGSRNPADLAKLKRADIAPGIKVALLTGGIDRPYVFGLAMELISKGAALDVIGSDTLDFPEFHGHPGLNFLNLQGSQRADVSLLRKVFRLLVFYAKLIRYAATAKPKIFHILWNNKFEWFDRTLLMFYYKILGKKIVLTVHNVNAGKRDSKDTYFNRRTLGIQYRVAEHIFVHTDDGKRELSDDFGVQETRVSVIPFPINNAVPRTRLTQSEAKLRLGIRDNNKAILFFGRITQYKGLEYLIAAFQQVLARHDDYRLIVAGRPENDFQKYWSEIQERTREDVRSGRMLLRADHIPDAETEVYFKAADVLVLPYKQMYQSGVMFLGYSFGLPVLASDVGGLKDEIIEGTTGFVFKSEDSNDLAATIERYFASDLFADLVNRRQEIIDFAKERHSWDVVGNLTMKIYAGLLRIPYAVESSNRDATMASLDVKAPHEAVRSKS